ncbi:MAG: CoA transferase subunit A [Chloroflexi bacterium]|nr:CoA transferase subunit A [Chloroflexota bacterium]
MEVLAQGTGEFKPPDPEGHRAYIQQHKSRALVSKVMTEQEAIGRFVSDGDYLSYDCNMLLRGPASLVRELIRQRKKDLWVGGKFTYVIVSLLAAAGCVSRVDVGFIGLGQALSRALDEGRIKMTEWSNTSITMRHLAGAMGIPFIPARFLGGADTFHYSGAKTVTDPFTGKPVTLLPAINPDVSLIHVHQCDVYGNARIFGTSVAPVETALSAKKLIISTEEIIDTEEIRRNPGRTTIPYYAVDAVVEAPFGAYPGNVPGLYRNDPDHVTEVMGAVRSSDPERLEEYMDKYIYSVSSHQEFLEKRVGLERLLWLKREEKIKEGYYI